MIDIEPVAAFKDNYIWLVSNPDTSFVVIVDPGDARPVEAALARLALTPAAILVTHHHHDHTGGIAALRRRYSIPVYGPARETVAGLTHPLNDGEEVLLPEIGLRLQTIDVPGHTCGAVAFYGDGLLFCGDTLFTGGCGRLFEGTAEQMHGSLARLKALPDETRMYCGHEYTLANLHFAHIVEPDNVNITARILSATQTRASGHPTVPSELGQEKRTNPFLRYDIPAVVTAAQRYAGRNLDTGAEVFGTVRRWKDSLDD